MLALAQGAILRPAWHTLPPVSVNTRIACKDGAAGDIITQRTGVPSRADVIVVAGCPMDTPAFVRIHVAHTCHCVDMAVAHLHKLPIPLLDTLLILRCPLVHRLAFPLRVAPPDTSELRAFIIATSLQLLRATVEMATLGPYTDLPAPVTLQTCRPAARFIVVASASPCPCTPASPRQRTSSAALA